MQLTLFDLPPAKREFNILNWLGKVIIDDVALAVSNIACTIICIAGMTILTIAIQIGVQEARREDKIEEIIHRRDEEDELLKEATPNWTDFERETVSANQKRMIIRWELKNRWKKDRRWRRSIEKELK